MTQTVKELLTDSRRADVPARLFGTLNFPFKVEPTIFDMAGMLATEYRGGYWNMFELSNGSWYMYPASETRFAVTSPNGYSGDMGADALGITACLFAFSHLSFGSGELAERCAEQYHWLRDLAMDHAESREILAACD